MAKTVKAAKLVKKAETARTVKRATEQLAPALEEAAGPAAAAARVPTAAAAGVLSKSVPAWAVPQAAPDAKGSECLADWRPGAARSDVLRPAEDAPAPPDAESREFPQLPWKAPDELRLRELPAPARERVPAQSWRIEVPAIAVPDLPSKSMGEQAARLPPPLRHPACAAPAKPGRLRANWSASSSRRCPAPEVLRLSRGASLPAPGPAR